MGHAASKPNRGHANLLSDEKKANICKMFDVRSRDRVPPINSEMLQNVWKDILSDGLKSAMIQHLFKSSNEKHVEDLEFLYFQMMEGTSQDKAEILMSILGNEGSIAPKNFQSYVSDLIESYLIIVRKNNPAAFESWPSCDLAEKKDLAIVAKFFVTDLVLEDGKIGLLELENWMSRCGFVSRIYESVVNYAFNMEISELLPVLPMANRSSSLLRVPTALALSYLIRTYSSEWRLLYSSCTDGQSFGTIRKNTELQGPTLVLVQDASGPLFGGFASHSWQISPKFYGNEQCFLFRLRPEMLICRASGYNNNFQYMNIENSTLPNGIGMGGQINYFGFFLDADFGPGSVSKTCTTFRDYIPLASQTEFTFIRLEIWGVDLPDEVLPIKVHTGGLIMERNQTGGIIKEKDKTGGIITEREQTAAALLEMVGKAGHSKSFGT